MTESSAHSLQKLPGWYPLAEYRRRLAVDGLPTPVVVNGDEISFQLRCGNCTVLGTAHDYFEGCSHWIYLLASNGKPIDQLRMPDVFGFLHEVEIVAPNEVSFGYFGTNDRWNLTVSESGFWSYAPAALWRRPNRFLLAKRHLAARRTKGKPWVVPETPNPSIEGTSTSGLRPLAAAPHVKR